VCICAAGAVPLAHASVPPQKSCSQAELQFKIESALEERGRIAARGTAPARRTDLER
jgi:hypothetical protein